MAFQRLKACDRYTPPTFYIIPGVFFFSFVLLEEGHVNDNCYKIFNWVFFAYRDLSITTFDSLLSSHSKTPILSLPFHQTPEQESPAPSSPPSSPAPSSRLASFPRIPGASPVSVTLVLRHRCQLCFYLLRIWLGQRGCARLVECGLGGAF